MDEKLNKGYSPYLIFLGLALVPLFLIACTGFDGLYGQDAYAYLDVAIHFSERAGKMFWPPVYAFLGYVSGSLFGRYDICLQAISILSWIVSGFIIFKITAWHGVGMPRSIVAAIFFLFSPFIFRSSVLVMSDILSIMLLLILAFFYRRHRSIPSGIFMLPLLAVLIFFTRYPLLLLFGLPALDWMRISEKKWLNPLFFLSLLLASLTFYFCYSRLIDMKGATGHYWLEKWSLANMFRSSFSHNEGNLFYNMPNILYVMKIFWHPGFLCSGFLLFLKPSVLYSRENIFLSVSLLVYLLFLSGIPMQNDRFLLPAFAWWLLVSLPSIRHISAGVWSTRAGMMLIATVIGILSFRALQPLLKRNALEREIASSVSEFRGQEIYGFDIDISLNVRCPGLNIKNLWIKHYAEGFPSGSLFIVQPTSLNTVWKGKLPWINFRKALDSGAVPVCRYPDGFVLFRMP